jgi:hypothetical protein
VNVSTWRRQQGLMNALSTLLVLDALAGLFVIGALANRIAFVNDFRSFNIGFNTFARANEVDDLAQAAGITMGILHLATAVVFIIWMFRAAQNNAGLGREHPRLGPGWAIGGWFIPLAFFVIPVLVMQDLWRGSHSSIPRGDMRWKIADRSALVGWWWAVLIVSVFVQGGLTTDDNPTPLRDLRTADTVSIIGTCFRIAAAVLAILVVRKLTERQAECLRVQQAQWSGPSGAPPPPVASPPASPPRPEPSGIAPPPAPPPAPPSAPPPGG